MKTANRFGVRKKAAIASSKTDHLQSILRILLTVLVAGSLLSASFISHAQKIEWSLELTESRRLPYLKILGSGADCFYILRSDAPILDIMESEDRRVRRFQLQCFNDGMAFLWERELECPIPDARIFHVAVIGNRLLTLAQKKREGSPIRDIYAQYLDAKGAFTGIPVLIDEAPLDQIDQDRLPTFFVNKDRSKWCITYRMINNSNDSHIACATVADTALNVIFRKEKTIDVPFKRFSPEHAVLMNDGSFHLLGRKYLTDKRIRSPEEALYQIIWFSSIDTSMVPYEIKLSDKYLTDASVAADEFNRRVVVGGFFSEIGMNTTAGIFSYSFPVDSGYLSPIRTAPFTNDVLIRSVADRGDFKQKELNNYYVDRLLVRKDGGVAVVAESYVENTQTYWDYYTRTTISHTYYRYGNILAASLNPDGRLAWNVSVQKEQSSMDDEGYQSSYCEMVSGGTYHAIYNKFIDRRSSILMTRINGLGEVDTKTLFGESERIIVLPRSAKQIDANSILTPAYKQGRLYLLKITLP